MVSRAEEIYYGDYILWINFTALLKLLTLHSEQIFYINNKNTSKLKKYIY